MHFIFITHTYFTPYISPFAFHVCNMFHLEHEAVPLPVLKRPLSSTFELKPNLNLNLSSSLLPLSLIP